MFTVLHYSQYLQKPSKVFVNFADVDTMISEAYNKAQDRADYPSACARDFFVLVFLGENKYFRVLKEGFVEQEVEQFEECRKCVPVS